MRGISRLKGRKCKPIALTASSRRGALTVEAALVLPVLLCAFFTVIFLIKAVYTYQLIGHALNETASEIASSAYIYHISGLRDVHDTVRNGINDKSDVFRNQVGTVFDTYNSLQNIGKNTDQVIGGLVDSGKLIKDAKVNFENMLSQAETIVSDPLEVLKCIACYIVGGEFDDAKTELFTPITKLYMKKYLVTESITNADERLEALNIAHGFNGLDFTESSFLSDRGEYIDIIVRYCIELPLPVQFTSGLEFVQRARVKAWMGGDEAQGVLTAVTDDIWSLGNFKRGLKIRRLFGANLPNSFPVISKYDKGHAVIIKSMDLTADSYQKSNNAEKTLMEYIEKLAEYKGQETPWGTDDIVIGEEDIISRELVLVIPKNELSDANEQLLRDMVHTAASRSITLTVERYGTKVIEGEKEGAADEAAEGEAAYEGETDWADDEDEAADEGEAENGSDQGGNDVDSETG